jgi:hypothetical protein
MKQASWLWTVVPAVVIFGGMEAGFFAVLPLNEAFIASIFPTFALGVYGFGFTRFAEWW